MRNFNPEIWKEIPEEILPHSIYGERKFYISKYGTKVCDDQGGYYTAKKNSKRGNRMTVGLPRVDGVVISWKIEQLMHPWLYPEGFPIPYEFVDGKWQRWSIHHVDFDRCNNYYTNLLPCRLEIHRMIHEMYTTKV